MAREDKGIDEIAEAEEEKLGRFNASKLRSEMAAASKANLLGAANLADKLEEMIAKGNDKSALFIVLSLAAFKDGLMDVLLDFFVIGVIPVVGQIPGAFVSAVLFYLMWGKGMLKGRLFALVLAFFIGDSLPIIEELPLTVVAVLFAWHGLVKRVQQAEADKERLGEMSVEEMENLAQAYEIEDEE
ncbi:MAG: hypothetical protein L6Q29_02840 [Candidatus Pacebacteria bacterium]|nr:hypothetical protein [Candidatus Paceibacterota bacterium]